MMQANSFKKIQLYKTGKSGKVYEKVVYPSDWKSEAGYEPNVRSTLEQEAEQTKTMQKYLFVSAQFPNNPALRKISQRKQLESLKLTPDELSEIEMAQNQQDEMETQQKQANIAQGNAGPAQDQQMLDQIQSKLQAINGQAAINST
jgi:hypothetical protein